MGFGVRTGKLPDSGDRRTVEPGRLDGALVSLRTTPRVISSMRLHIKDRIPLTGPGKFDNLPGDDPVRKIVREPEGCSRHFKRDIENPVGFSINIEVA